MRILIVEDEYVSLTKMKAIFSEIGKCDLASNGKEALDLFHRAYLESTRYDLITIDIDIPIINGIELLKMITKDEELLFIPPAKKMVITASSSVNNVFLAIENKCDAYLVKPVKREVLKEKLRTLGC